MCGMQERSADKDLSDSKRKKESPDAKDIEARVNVLWLTALKIKKQHHRIYVQDKKIGKERVSLAKKVGLLTGPLGGSVLQPSPLYRS